MVRFKASIVLPGRKEVLALVRIPMVLCQIHRDEATTASILDIIPAKDMATVAEQAKRRTGMSVNPDRVDVIWVRITGQPPNGAPGPRQTSRIIVPN